MTTDEAIASILERLSAIRADADVSLVIRHAEREEIQTGTFGYHVALTAQGISSAQQLGAALSERRSISSPVPRCVQTAEAILLSAGSSTGVSTDRRLGDPGAFILEPESPGPSFLNSQPCRGEPGPGRLSSAPRAAGSGSGRIRGLSTDGVFNTLRSSSPYRVLCEPEIRTPPFR